MSKCSFVRILVGDRNPSVLLMNVVTFFFGDKHQGFVRRKCPCQVISPELYYFVFWKQEGHVSRWIYLQEKCTSKVQNFWGLEFLTVSHHLHHNIDEDGERLSKILNFWGKFLLKVNTSRCVDQKIGNLYAKMDRI